MVVFIVTGTPGVGKTTVVQEALRKMPDIGLAVYGDVMFEIAKNLGLVQSRDEMRTKIPPEKYTEIQHQAAKKIGAMKGNVLVDTHCTVKTPEGYFPGLPEFVLRALKPKVIVLIEARPEDILKRRKKDESMRERKDFGGAEEIIEQQELNRAFAASYAMISNASVKILINEQGKAKKTAEKLCGVLK